MDSTNQRVNSKEEKTWIIENRKMQAGLIGAGVVLIQPFMYQGEFIGLAAKICAISFAVSLPLLGALLLLNFDETRQKHISRSPMVSFMRIVGQIGAQIGIVAAFWHIHRYVGAAMLIAGIVGGIAYMVGYKQLYGRRG